MYSERRNGNEIIFAPPKGKGASLTIRYSLPRDCRYSMFTENFPNAAVHLVERVGPSRWCDGRKCRSPPRALIDHDDPRLFARLARCQAALSSNVRLCPKILSGCVSSEQDRIGFAARVEVPAFIRFRARQALARFSDANGETPRQPEHREIAGDEGHETRVRRRKA